MKKIPTLLRTWFLIHFIVDMLFAIPLIFAPIYMMRLFGFEVDETMTVRLVGAALAGIGGVSLWAHKEGYESFKALLRLKILWSGSAIVAIVLYLIEGGNSSAWLFFIIFLLFSVVWSYYYIVNFSQQTENR